MKSDKVLKCVIFDMDGCLVDTEKSYVRSWKYAFKVEKFPIDDSIIDLWAGMGTTNINSQLYELTQDLNRAKKIRQLREDIFFEMLEAGKVELKPYARDILGFIREKKIKIGLASSTFKDKALRILGHFELLSFFDFMVFGDEVNKLKPAPDIYLKALRISKENISNCLVFEDSVSGVEAAKEAGFTKIVHIPDSSISNNQVELNTFARVDNFFQGIELINKIIGWDRF
jgi:HAD superfamily hydrolase (TIGR01509 family)